MSSKKAVELNTNAMHLSTAKQAPSVNEPQAKSSPTDKNGAMRQQIIDAATTKLNTTASVMQTATENYQKASDKLVDVQVEVGKIQAELAGLEASNINLDKIKAILVKCIDILVQLKSQINRLVAFFSAVSSLVEHVVEDQVKPFITYLDAATGIEKEPAILNFSFTNFQQQIIYNFCLSIRAYFDLFRDIGGMYLDVYTQFIRPGLEMVTNMQSEYNSAGDPKSAQKELDKRNKEVGAYFSEAIGGVKKLVAKDQAQITDNLASNAQQAADDLGFVAVRPPPAIQEAVTESREISKDAAAKGIDATGQYTGRQLADTSSLGDDSDD
jgi:hypothetical protein